jgi:hypothetical protein
MQNCRVYPNGEFSIWTERATTKISLPPEQPDYLGLSLLDNSHRQALGLADPPPEKAQRGLKGISRLGARTVRNAAFLLQQKYGKENLTFLTCTLPPVSETAEYRAGAEWAEIVRIFNQGITRLLAAAGLPKTYVGCTEIQMKRYKRDGGLPLHLHIVFPGRHRFKGWAIGCEQFRAAWRNAVVARCPEYGGASWGASIDAVKVEKDVEGYLGKYLTKGVASLNAILEDDPGLAEFMPRAWWCCSLNLKRAIGKRITGGNGTARKLLQDIRAQDSRISFSRVIEIAGEDGTRYPVAIIGKLSPEGRNRYAAGDSRAVTVAKLNNYVVG